MITEPLAFGRPLGASLWMIFRLAAIALLRFRRLHDLLARDYADTGQSRDFLIEKSWMCSLAGIAFLSNLELPLLKFSNVASVVYL